MMRKIPSVLTILIMLSFFAGCANVPVHQQKHVSQVGMLFSDTPTESDQVNLISQIEPGNAASGGAQSAGCTACR